MKFVEKIQSKVAVIGVVGLGYVGIHLLIQYVEEGYQVIGFDIDQTKVSKLLDRQSYIEHISEETISRVIEKGFIPTTDFIKIKEVDAIIICVPTPLNKYREPDLSFVMRTMETIGPYIKEGQLLSLESTTYPGTTEEELMPKVLEKGFEVG